MRELLAPKMTTALEIAVLCQALPIQQAASLIQQYADTVAAGARVDATAEAAERMDQMFRRVIDGGVPCAK